MKQEYLFVSATEGAAEVVLTSATGDVRGSATLETKDALLELLQKASETPVVVVVPSAASEVSLRRLYRHDGREYPLGQRLLLDFSSMTWPLVHTGFMRERDLKSACAHFEVNYDPKAEASALRECFFRWTERVSLGQKVEEFGRSLLGGLGEGLVSLAQKIGKKEQR